MIYFIFTVYIHLCLLWPDVQTDGQTIHRIDAHQQNEFTKKKNQTSILNNNRENYVFVFLHFCHLLHDRHTDGQTTK